MERLRRELREARALGWSGLVGPTRLRPPENGYINGWLCNVYQSGRVWQAWSEKTRHGDGHRTDQNTSKSGLNASHDGCALYASKLDALIALRLQKERELARILADIDAQIEAEREGSSV